ncbi:MAG TPA: AsmA family protein, partial [Methylomirabilota bacterium]|nr:AsmA family protein [Methylomirabilota bacterium]
MRRAWKWVLGAAAAVVLLVVAVLAAVPYLVDTPRVQALIAGTASQALGRPVRFESVSIAVLPLPAVELHKLQVAEDPRFGTTPFLTLETGRLQLRLWPLLTGRVEFGTLRLQKPLITVIQGPDGRLNIASLGPPEPRAAGRPGRSGGAGGAAGAGAVLGSRVKIEDGVVTYVARGKGEAATRYRVEDLDLTLEGTGSQVAFGGAARVTPGDLALKVSDGVLGLPAGRSLVEAPVRGKVRLEAKDVADLVAAAAGPSPSVGGALTGALALGGTLGSPSAAGDVELSRVRVTQTHPACPEPKRRTLEIPTLKLNASYQDGRLAGRPVTATLGGGAVSAQLLVSPERGVRVQLSDIAVRALPLEKLLVDYLCQGYAITGPLDLTGGAEFSLADLWSTLSGPGTLRAGPGKVVGSQALALLGGVARVAGAVSGLLGGDPRALSGGSPL